MVEYARSEEIPLLSEFCFDRGYSREMLVRQSAKNETLYQAIELLHLKKEAVIERGGLLEILSDRMAIFSLKQMGFTDNPDRPTHRPEVSDDDVISIPPAPDIEEAERIFDDLGIESEST